MTGGERNLAGGSDAYAETGAAALIELRGVSKYFGNVIALRNVSLKVHSGEVMCLLGDNGAGKSTLIKCLSGVHPPDRGEVLVDGRAVRFDSPREALECGIATVYQDLAMIPLMSIARNFFLGAEPTVGWGPFRRFDTRTADVVTREELGRMGIDVRDTSQPVGTLSGGERQSVAIARAVHFGARVLILDEPTSALGVKEAGIVLKYIARARSRGVGVIFITHNIHHAYPIGDRFTILNRGQSYGTFDKADITRDEMLTMMAGGEELSQLDHELEKIERGGEGGKGELADNEGGQTEPSGDRAEHGGDRAEYGGDRAEQDGDRAERDGDRAERGGDRTERGGDRTDSNDGGSKAHPQER